MMEVYESSPCRVCGSTQTEKHEMPNGEEYEVCHQCKVVKS